MTVDLLTDLVADDDVPVDPALLQDVSSVAIPGGLHAGTPAGMLQACRAATQAGVAIGAHVGFNDPIGRGARYVDTDPEELAAEVVYQLGALDGIALTCGSQVTFVRCAGALADAVDDRYEEAEAVAAAVAEYDDSLMLLVPTGSALQRAAASRGILTVNEFIADRTVGRRGRATEGLTICTTDPATVAHRVSEALSAARPPRSIGVHPQHHAATGALVRTVRRAIDERGFQVTAFSR